MKRLFVIILILCAWVTYPMLQAQVYTTSSASYRSISNGGMVAQPATSAFRSTSTHIARGHMTPLTSSISYSTAPMHVANGNITTVASQLKGGVLADIPSSSNGFAPKQRAVIPGVPLPQPLVEGLDIFLFLGLLSILYAIYLTRKISRAKT